MPTDETIDASPPSWSADADHPRLSWGPQSRGCSASDEHDEGAPTHDTGIPPGCEAYRTTRIFTEATIPSGLLGRHHTAVGTWGLIRVLEGRLLYRILDPPSERVLDPSAPPGVVEPGVPHQVAPLPGPLRFQVEFYRRT